MWQGHGPLAYIGEIDCEQIGTFPLDIKLPSSGHLLFFYFDGSFDNFAATVGTWDAATLQGARVVHVAGDASLEKRPTPTGLKTYPERQFRGRPILTAPGWEHPDLSTAFRTPGQDHRGFMDHPVNDDAFVEALHERHTGPLHQIGGYADAVQGPVEHEVALSALGNEVPYDDSRLDDEARRWELVLQVDTDEDLNMEWGDAGVLYWMGRVGESEVAEAIDEFSFTWQCG